MPVLSVISKMFWSISIFLALNLYFSYIIDHTIPHVKRHKENIIIVANDVEIEAVFTPVCISL